MPEKYHTRAMLVETRAADTGAKRYRFRASTAAVARDGMSIPSGEWRTDNYLRNPVVLASHDYFSLPIGRTVSLEQDDEGLIAEIEYDADDPTARDVMRKLDGGFMHAVSVGFRPGRTEWPSREVESGIFRDVELLEISNVAVPSDPNALALRSLTDDTTPTDSEWADRVARLEERIAALEAARSEASDDEPAPEATEPAPAVDIDLSRFPNLMRSS